jgi:hypothetical protein
VKVLIEISLGHYDRLLDKCDERSCPEFAILRHGVFTRRPNGDRFQRTIQIRCEMEQAKRLLDLAAKLCPEAVPEIEKVIGTERGS